MADVEIQILGPLIVRRGGAEVRLPAGRARVVLAVLALHHDEVVSRERLVDAAWADRVPATAITQLQGIISMLRRTLTGDIIETHGRGYRLRLAPRDLDLARMQTAVAAGRRAQRADRLAEAADAYRAALALWRDGPFEGLDSAYLAGHAVRLDESRGRLVEEWARTELALGRPNAVIDALTDQLHAHPLREPVSALLMTALYRAGRQAEALATFRTTRAALRDAIGVEPGVELQELHRRMLAADRTLLSGAQAGPDSADDAVMPSDATAVPLAQLPPDIADFTGREHHVKELVEALRASADEPGATRTALITGPGGVGKTALAVHVAHLLRGRYRDAQIYANLRSSSTQPVTSAQVAGRVLRDLGVAPARIPADEEELIAAYRSALADRAVLVVLDDARDSAHVRPLLPASGDSAVLITSRYRMPALPATRLDLGVLDPVEGSTLFARIVGAERAAAEPDAVGQILAACGYLPLAVRVAASRLATRPAWAVGTLADRLAAPEYRLDELAVEDQQARATFAVSYQALPPDEARAFRLVAVADLDDIAVGGAAALLDLDARTAERLAEALVDVNLLAAAAPGRYRYHDLIRLYAQERAEDVDGPAERARALRRLLAWYRERTRSAINAARPGKLPPAQNSQPFRDAAAAKQWLDEEHLNITGLIRSQAEATMPDIEALTDIVRNVSWYLRSRGHWPEWERATRAVLAAALDARSPAAELVARGQLGQLALFRGDAHEAREQLDQALALARGVGDRPAEAYLLTRLGALAHQENRMRDAIGHCDAAHTAYRDVGDRQGQFNALANVAMGHRVLHESGRALEVLSQAAELVDQLADPEAETMLLHQTACCHADLGEFDRAIAMHEECLSRTRRLGQREGEAYTLAELGRAHLAADRPRAAATHLSRAVDHFQALGEANATAFYRIDLGRAYQADGRPDAARTVWAEALEHFGPRDAATAASIRQLMTG